VPLNRTAPFRGTRTRPIWQSWCQVIPLRAYCRTPKAMTSMANTSIIIINYFIDRQTDFIQKLRHRVRKFMVWCFYLCQPVFLSGSDVSFFQSDSSFFFYCRSRSEQSHARVDWSTLGRGNCVSLQLQRSAPKKKRRCSLRGHRPDLGKRRCSITLCLVMIVV